MHKGLRPNQVNVTECTSQGDGTALCSGRATWRLGQAGCGSKQRPGRHGNTLRWSLQRATPMLIQQSVNIWPCAQPGERRCRVLPARRQAPGPGGVRTARQGRPAQAVRSGAHERQNLRYLKTGQADLLHAGGGASLAARPTSGSARWAHLDWYQAAGGSSLTSATAR